MSKAFFPAAAAAIALSALPALADEYSDGETDPRFSYSVSVAPFFSAPRLNDLDGALNSAGISAINLAVREAGASQSAELSGFEKTDYGYGIQFGLTHEFDSEFRGGVQLGVQYAGTSSTVRHVETISSTYFTIISSTEYSISETVSLPLVTIGVFVQRVFHLEAEPRLKLYLGGWGEYGALVAASLEGKVRNFTVDPIEETPYSIELAGDGWGAGGLAGVEYAWLSWIRLYAETGFEYLKIDGIEQTGSINRYAIPAGPFTDANGKPIPLDMSGVFLRFGAKFALGGGER